MTMEMRRLLFAVHQYFRIVVLAWLCPVVIGMSATASADDRPIDWSSWKRLPLFEGGRIMPLDTFARRIVEKLTGRPQPILGPPMTPDGQLDRQHPLFPDGLPRKWPAVELLFSWLAESEKWEDVPFLQASHQDLRERLLKVPLVDASGKRLSYVSPRDVENSMEFEAYLRDLSQRRREVESRGQRFRMSGLDLHAARLWDAYATFRLLTYQPRLDSRPWFPPNVKVSHPIPRRLESLIDSWTEIEPQLQQLADLGVFSSGQSQTAGPGEPGEAPSGDQSGSQEHLVARARAEFAPLIRAAESEEITIAELDDALTRLQPLLREIALCVESLQNRAFSVEAPDATKQLRLDDLRSNIRLLAEKSRRLADEVEVCVPMLYDTGVGPHVLPAMIPACLNSATNGDEPVSPWLSLGAVLYGSKNVLRGYDIDRVNQVRSFFQMAAAAYADRRSHDRTSRVEENLDQFSAALAKLGRSIEAERERLPVDESHRELLALTAYPPAGFTDWEVFYNEFDPFRWSWIINLLAFGVLLLGVGRLRQPALWIGVLVLTVAQVVTIYGFGLRVAISGWAPVTNMFESVVFTSLVIGLLGVGFVIQPLVGKGIREGWEWVSLLHEPLTGKREARTWQSEGTLVTVVRGIAILARLALGGLLFYYLAIVPYDVGKSRAVFDLVPEITRSLGSPTFVSIMMNLLGWFVGMCVLLSVVWLVPRFAVGMILSLLWTIPVDLKTAELGPRLNEVVLRRPFAVAAAGLAFLAAVVAYYTPVWDKGIEPLQPVLRDRLWLFAHVLTITAGYGAGLLAWGLGNISLLYFLFGRYQAVPRGEIIVHGEAHRSVDGGGRDDGLTISPPLSCFTLATYMYKAIQFAVILLTAGTILGGVWADRAWGRFWGWDPKEVWALISILVYMALLHGRYIGWVNTFGLAAGSVFGMISVVWAWYGTNYLMPAGLHAYAGEGGGGGLYVVGAFTANLLFVALAWMRYRAEMAKGQGAVDARRGEETEGHPDESGIASTSVSGQ